MIEKVAVIGGGLMGSGIAEVTARAGLPTIVVEVSATAADEARQKVEASLLHAAKRGKLSDAGVAETLDRLTFSATVDDVADRDLVIEAASEVEQVKLDLFRRLGDAMEKDDAILVSNTSSIPIVKLGAVSGRPDRVMGVHFFNPAPVMHLVELIPSLTTGDVTKERMKEFVSSSLGKQPIEATDRAGFVVNSLLVPYLLSAIRMYEAGYASATDIDQGMIACATSSDVPIFRSGRRDSRSFLTARCFGSLTSLNTPSVRPVIVGPGDTLLHRMPSGPHSRAICLTSINSPALATEYAPNGGAGQCPHVDPVATMLPPDSDSHACAA